MICDNGLCDFAANLCFPSTKVTCDMFFLLGRFITILKERSKTKCLFLGAARCCLVSFGDFHTAHRKNNNTKMCLPLGRQAENMRAGKLALDFGSSRWASVAFLGGGEGQKGQNTY